jgi:GNAT superfamily N-acetyltransferase
VEADTEAVLCLLQESFPRWPRVDVSVEPIEHLRWKLCLDMEEADKDSHRVAEVGGRIVGVGITSARRAKLGDRIVRCYEGNDVCVHPAYRERGILSKMGPFRQDESRERYAVQLVGGTSHPALIGLRRRNPMPSHTIGNRFHPSLRPLTWRGLSSALKLRWGRSPGRLASAAWETARWLAGRLRQRNPRERHAWWISSVEAFDDRVDAFWQEASQPFAFVVVRDLQYLNARYGDPRAGNFTINLAEQNGALLGYTVLCVEPGGDRGYVAELLTLPGRRDVADSLLRDALDHFRRLGRATVECWLPEHHPYRQILDELGFLPRPQGRYARGYRALGASEEELAFLREPEVPIHRTLGDTDIV